MAAENRLNQVITTFNRLPGFARRRALTLFFGRMVPFTGTAGIQVDELTPTQSVIRMRNRRRVQNHIGGVHAVASLLIAESATGFLVGLHVPDDRVPVIKTVRGDYVKRAKGDLTVTARLTEDQIRSIRETEKGETSVAVELKDEADQQPVLIEMIWAWTPKKR